jgi:hypothetical protein
MKWPVTSHTLTSTIGRKLSVEHKMVYSFLIRDLTRYLTAYTLREDLMKDFLRSWNEIASDSFFPVLHCVMKGIRHKLLSTSSSTIVTYHRLIHLLNAMIRYCGVTAAILIGKEKFLRTLVYLIGVYKKKPSILARESAGLAYRCLKQWQDGMKDGKIEIFSNYDRYGKKVEKKHKDCTLIDLSRMILTNVEKLPLILPEEYKENPSASAAFGGSSLSLSPMRRNLSNRSLKELSEEEERKQEEKAAKEIVRQVSNLLSTIEQQEQDHVTGGSSSSLSASTKDSASPSRALASVAGLPSASGVPFQIAQKDQPLIITVNEEDKSVELRSIASESPSKGAANGGILKKNSSYHHSSRRSPINSSPTRSPLKQTALNLAVGSRTPSKFILQTFDEQSNNKEKDNVSDDSTVDAAYEGSPDRELSEEERENSTSSKQNVLSSSSRSPSMKHLSAVTVSYDQEMNQVGGGVKAIEFGSPSLKKASFVTSSGSPMKLSASGYPIRVEPSPMKKGTPFASPAKPPVTENMDVTVKFYGTQRVVSYRKTSSQSLMVNQE